LNVSREPLLLAFQRDDKLAAAKSILPRQLKSRRLVLLSSAADLAHDKILAGLQAWGYRPEKTLDVISLAQAFDFVASGEVIAVVRASAGRFESKRIVFRSLSALPMLDVGLAYRRDIRSPLVRNLLRIVHEVFAEERAQMMQSSQKS
jgi:DNA-binding transcriptional LysR family regulator